MVAIRSHTSADGRHRIDFHRNTAALVRFTESVWREEAREWAEGGIDRYWGFGHQSGLYASLDEAALAAEQQLGWFDATALDRR